MADRPAVVIFRSGLLARSETFILAQANHLQRYRPVFAGLVRYADGLDLGAAPSETLAGAWSRFAAKNLAWWPRRALDRLRAQRPALVHAHFGPDGVLALPLARALGVPLVVTFHGYDASVPVHCAGLPRRRWPRWMHRYALGRPRLIREAAAVVAVSHRVRELVLRQGFPPERITVRHIGIDLPPPPTAPADAHAGTPPVVFVGRLVAKKGVLTLLAAWRRLAARGGSLPRLRIVGDGPLRAAVAGATEGLDVELLGFRPHDEVRGLLAAAACAVVPSETGADGDEEGMPTVLLEAFACGCPVVATRHAGIPDVARDGVDSLLVPERDAEALATALGRMLDDVALRRRLGAAARARAEAFAIGPLTAGLEALYAGLPQPTTGG